ncbi:MAG: carboxypeptidase-like regulatory domain-containing protein [Candidatus Solibacter sp.]
MRARRNSSLLALAASLHAWAQAPAPSSAEPASVEGMVTHAVSGAPVVRAHVLLRGTARDAKTYGAITTAEGTFAISGIPPGNYYATVDRVGFFMPALPGGRNSVQLSLKAKDKKEDLKLQLAPLGSISGRVVDAKGDPVEGATVTPDTGQGANGQAREVSDDQGRFRLAGLTPGKYRVKAANTTLSSLPSLPEIRTDGTVEVRYVPTYYGGVTDFKSATRVELGTGAEVNGIEIAMVRLPHVRISGRVQGVPAETRVALIFGQVNGGSRSSSGIRKDGTFEVWDIDPGKYVLSAGWTAGDQRVQTSPFEIEIGESHIDRLELRVVPPSDLAGSILFEDEAARPPTPKQGAQQGQAPNMPQGPQGPGMAANRGPRIELRAVDPAIMMVQNSGLSSDVGPEGGFQLKGVAAARYGVTLTWPNAWVKSISLGSQTVEGNVVNLRDGSGGAALTVLVSSAFGTISGKVSDASGPVAGARVVLVSEDWISTGDNSMTVTEETGVYKFPRVRPGKYRIAAIEAGDSAPFMGVLDDYEDIFARVDVRPKDQLTKDLKRHAPIR